MGLMTRSAGTSLGTASFANPGTCAEVAQTVLKAAYERGIIRFDVAPLYGGGLSEERLGNFLHDVDDQSVKATTKCGRYRAYGAAPANRGGTTDWRDYSYQTTLKSVERSLNLLGDDRIEVVFIHDPDAHVKEALHGAYPALMGLKSQGVIGGVGIASNRPETIHTFLQAEEFDALMLANAHSVLNPLAATPVLDLAKSKGTKTYIAGVFLSGILASGLSGSRNYRYGAAPKEVLDDVGSLEAICRNHGVKLGHLALSYLKRDGRVDVVTLGASSPSQLVENIEWMRTPLPDALWADLNVERPELPYPMRGPVDP